MEHGIWEPKGTGTFLSFVSIESRVFPFSRLISELGRFPLSFEGVSYSDRTKPKSIHMLPCQELFFF